MFFIPEKCIHQAKDDAFFAERNMAFWHLFVFFVYFQYEINKIHCEARNAIKFHMNSRNLTVQESAEKTRGVVFAKADTCASFGFSIHFFHTEDDKKKIIAMCSKSSKSCSN